MKSLFEVHDLHVHATADPSVEILRGVSFSMNAGEVRVARPDLATLVITHYQRLLTELRPDYVHVLIDGKIVETGDLGIVQQLERNGFSAWMEPAT